MIRTLILALLAALLALGCGRRVASEADQIIVNAGGHLQRWNLTTATLESTEQLPPYFDRPECHNGNLVRWCALGHADAYAPPAPEVGG